VQGYGLFAGHDVPNQPVRTRVSRNFSPPAKPSPRTGMSLAVITTCRTKRRLDRSRRGGEDSSFLSSSLTPPGDTGKELPIYACCDRCRP
jgi:hypothetical protein